MTSISDSLTFGISIFFTDRASSTFRSAAKNIAQDTSSIERSTAKLNAILSSGDRAMLGSANNWRSASTTFTSSLGSMSNRLSTNVPGYLLSDSFKKAAINVEQGTTSLEKSTGRLSGVLSSSNQSAVNFSRYWQNSSSAFKGSSNIISQGAINVEQGTKRLNASLGSSEKAMLSASNAWKNSSNTFNNSLGAIYNASTKGGKFFSSRGSMFNRFTADVSGGKGGFPPLLPPGGGGGGISPIPEDPFFSRSLSALLAASMVFRAMQVQIKYVADAFMEFEKSMIYTEFISKSLSSNIDDLAKSMSNVREFVLAKGFTSIFGPRETSQAVKSFVQGGVAPAAILSRPYQGGGDNLVELALRYSLLTDKQIDSAKASEFLISLAAKTGIAMDGSAESIHRLSRALDMMTAAQNISLLRLSEMPEVLNSARQGFSNLQMSGNEGIATMLAIEAAVRTAGRSAKESGLAFKTIGAFATEAMNIPMFRALSGLDRKIMVGSKAKFEVLGGLMAPYYGITDKGLAIDRLMVDKATGKFRNILSILSEMEDAFAKSGYGPAHVRTAMATIFGSQISAEVMENLRKYITTVTYLPYKVDKENYRVTDSGERVVKKILDAGINYYGMTPLAQQKIMDEFSKKYGVSYGYKKGEKLTGFAGIEYTKRTMLDSANLSKQLEEMLKDTLWYAKEAFNAAKDTFAVIFGEHLKGDIVTGLQFITSAFKTLGTVIKDYPIIGTVLSKIVLFVAGIAAIATGKALFGFIGGQLGLFGGGMTALLTRIVPWVLGIYAGVRILNSLFGMFSNEVANTNLTMDEIINLTGGVVGKLSAEDAALMAQKQQMESSYSTLSALMDFITGTVIPKFKSFLDTTLGQLAALVAATGLSFIVGGVPLAAITLGAGGALVASNYMDREKLQKDYFNIAMNKYAVRPYPTLIGDNEKNSVVEKYWSEGRQQYMSYEELIQAGKELAEAARLQKDTIKYHDELSKEAYKKQIEAAKALGKQPSFAPVPSLATYAGC